MKVRVTMIIPPQGEDILLQVAQEMFQRFGVSISFSSEDILEDGDGQEVEGVEDPRAEAVQAAVVARAPRRRRAAAGGVPGAAVSPITPVSTTVHDRAGAPAVPYVPAQRFATAVSPAAPVVQHIPVPTGFTQRMTMQPVQARQPAVAGPGPHGQGNNSVVYRVINPSIPLVGRKLQVRTYLLQHPNSSARDIAAALQLSQHGPVDSALYGLRTQGVVESVQVR